jgi:tryptophan-rich sensory protein
MRAKWPLLVVFVAVVMGIGAVVGLISAPGTWFEALRKPDFVAPDWLSGTAWALLCVAFAVAGWRLWLQDSGSVETRLWLATLILSWWFAPIFFVAHAPYVALVVAAVLVGLMVIFIIRAWRREPVSAWLFVPCAVWVSYGAVMTGVIAAMN